jgi:opacity protein-like surface antigen
MHPFSFSPMSPGRSSLHFGALLAVAALILSAAPAAAQGSAAAREDRPLLGAGLSIVTDGGDTGIGVAIDFARAIYSTSDVAVAPVGDFGWHSFDGFKSLTFMGGGRVTAGSGRFAPFGQFLIGSFRVSTSFCDDCSETRLVMTPGGGMDIAVHRKLNVRAQIDFLMIMFPDETTHARRFTFGVSLPFGG